MPVPLHVVLANWAAMIALWAVPYLTLLHHFKIEASDALQWSLVIVAIVGSGSMFHQAWKTSREPRWRASHGLLGRPGFRTKR